MPAVGRLMALLCALLPGACGCAQWTGLALADATAPEGPARPACTFPASASEWGMPAPLSDTLEGDARRDNSASSGMITSTKTELQIPQ